MTLDPDDPRPPYQQVAAALRAAILTKKIAPGDRLPSGPELARTYGVARMTVQNALRLLRDEGLVVSRAGSGVFVRQRTERPVGLRPHMERAFLRDEVTVDFAGFSGETLHGVMQEPLDLIRAGRLRPSRISVRVLTPDVSRPMAVPARVADLGDDPEFRQRAEAISRRHLGGLFDAVTELQDLGLVDKATAEVRRHPLVPMFKLYVLNDEDAFFGFYPVTPHAVTIKGTDHDVYDLMGKDTTLFHHTTTDDPDDVGSVYVAEARRWFDSIWNTIAKEPESAS